MTILRRPLCRQCMMFQCREPRDAYRAKYQAMARDQLDSALSQLEDVRRALGQCVTPQPVAFCSSHAAPLHHTPLNAVAQLKQCSRPAGVEAEQRLDEQPMRMMIAEAMLARDHMTSALMCVHQVVNRGASGCSKDMLAGTDPSLLTSRRAEANERAFRLGDYSSIQC